MQQNNGMKFSRDRKNYINFQLDVLGGGGWGYFENVQWTLCAKELICVWPLNLLFSTANFSSVLRRPSQIACARYKLSSLERFFENGKFGSPNV